MKANVSKLYVLIYLLFEKTVIKNKNVDIVVN